jgi:hypothetical protein
MEGGQDLIASNSSATVEAWSFGRGGGSEEQS